MAGMSEGVPLADGSFPVDRIAFNEALKHIVIGLGLVWLFPNVRQIVAKFRPTWEDVAGVQAPAPMPSNGFLSLLWRPTLPYALACSILFVACLYSLSRVSEFLYFQF